MIEAMCPMFVYYDYHFKLHLCGFSNFVIIMMVKLCIGYLSFIFTYVNCGQRFIYSLKGSMFELKKLHYFLHFCNVLLFVVWFWSLLVVYIIAVWTSNDVRSHDAVIWILDTSYQTYDYTRLIVPKLYVLCSIIAMSLFIYKFGKIVVLMHNVIETSTQQGQHGVTQHFVGVVSRTTVLVTFGIVSTMCLLIFFIITQDLREKGNVDPYLFEYFCVGIVWLILYVLVYKVNMEIQCINV